MSRRKKVDWTKEEFFLRETTVYISLRDENELNCSYAIVRKGEKRVILILQGMECAIYDAFDLQHRADSHYLLLKHYATEAQAYRDFLKLIGKMCAKKKESKYFGIHLDEDNRMVVPELGEERMYSAVHDASLLKRYYDFCRFITLNHTTFFHSDQPL